MCASTFQIGGCAELGQLRRDVAQGVRMNHTCAARRAVALATIVACAAAVVVRDAGASLAAAVAVPPVSDQAPAREPLPLTLAIEDDGASLVARGTGDDPAQPVVIQAGDGAIVATCGPRTSATVAPTWRGPSQQRSRHSCFQAGRRCTAPSTRWEPDGRVFGRSRAVTPPEQS